MKLTPNRRMAVFLQDALPLTVWLENLYLELTSINVGTYPDLLGINEELVVWEKIISESDIGQTLFKTTGTARLAREAWMLSVQWRIPHVEEAKQTEDTRAYYEWASQYQALCTRKRWLDSATFVDALIDPILKKKIDLPKEITLVGFEELTPQLIYFFDKLKEVDIHVKSVSQVLFKAGAKRIPAVDVDEELRFAAFMAKRWLGEKSKTQKTIGIVVPDLERQRYRVVRLFEEVLSPESFNVAAPIALSRYPMIEAALLALNLLLGESSLEKFSQFLRSPFFGDDENEKISRAALDVQIRRLGESEFTFAGLIKKSEYLLKTAPELTCSSWLEQVQNFAKERSSVWEKKSANEWRNKILALLEILGWPGHRLSSVKEQEIQQQWHRLLADYVNMGRVLSDHDYQEALRHLMRLARETSFLPTSPHRPIQVLGLLEAVGIPFDYLWVTGLHREVWPLDPMPNPFIPLSMQRERNLPRSSPARELSMAKKFTERLCQGANEVIFSYPTLVDGHHSAVSSLLAHLPEVTKDFFNIPKALSYLEIQGRVRSFESQWKEPAPKVNLSASPVFGGTRLLKLQSLCPFRAFAEGRLKALPLPAPKALGLNGAERGEIIHEALYIFWEGIENQTQLQAITEEVLKDRIQAAVEFVLQGWQLRRPYTLTPHYLALEKKRTFQLLYRFIQLEKSRPYFEIVAREEEKLIDLQGLKFKIRIDRVDRLSNLDEIILDYKTGEVSLSDWFGKRPRDPQLPVYCVTRTPRSAGIIYGIIRPLSIKYQGITKDEAVLPGVKTVAQTRSSLEAETSWEEQVMYWEKNLGLLAKDFIEGVAIVDPIDGANTCRTCSLKSLCRVNALPSVSI